MGLEDKLAAEKVALDNPELIAVGIGTFVGCASAIISHDYLSSAGLGLVVAAAVYKIAKAGQTLSSRDPLTGLGNRRKMRTDLERLHKGRKPFTCITIDINGFKKVNDTYGHNEGDWVLETVGRVINSTIRGEKRQDGDYAYRVGGDEFLIVLSGYEGVERVMNQITSKYNQAVEMHGILTGPRLDWNSSRNCDANSVKDILNLSDQGMYANKRK